MYLSGLQGVAEFEGWPNGITQATADARWLEIGASPPAPLVPAELVGVKPIFSRGLRLFQLPNGKQVNISKFRDPKAVNDFLNFFAKAAVDPYRKQSTISKVAGHVIDVAAIAIPVLSTAKAITDVANVGLALQNAKTDEKLAERVITPAVDAMLSTEQNFIAQESAAKDAALAAQLKALQEAAAFAPPSLSASTGQIAKPATKKTDDMNFFVLGGAILLGLLVARSI